MKMSTDLKSKLTAQQQQRITDNYRAAKAIQARKRPHLLPQEDGSPAKMLLPHRRMAPHSAMAFRDASPAKRMCTPSLPNLRERTPLGELSGNIQVPNRPPQFGETHPCKTPTSSIKLCNNNAEGQCADTHDINTEASLLKNPLGSESRQQQIRTQDSVVTLQDDICEVFDSQLLRELDDFCNKQPKKPSNAYQELSDSPIRIASRLDTTDSISPSRGWVSLQKDVMKTESLGLSTTKTSGEQLAKHSTAVSHVTNAFPCMLPIECVAPSITEKPISAEQATVSEDTECLHLDSATTTEPISAAYPATEPNPSRANSGCSDVTVTQLLIAPSTSNRAAACDTDLPEHLRKLNESQREAALSDTFKPLLILAGPGSGKTSTMVARLLTLLREGVEAKNILAMTFTTAAATEMRQRVGIATGKSVAKELSISTFHSFCLQLCRAHADKLGRSAEFLVYGHGQQRKAVFEATRLAMQEAATVQGNVDADESSDLKTIGKENTLSPAMWKDKGKKWQQFVTQAKAAGMTSMDYQNVGNTLGAAVLRHYEGTLAACDALDYHDFITFAVRLLEKNPEGRTMSFVFTSSKHPGLPLSLRCSNTMTSPSNLEPKKWTCMLVDEFQDTSVMQYRFLRLLASHNRVTIVGDDDQSIFSFNGANASGFDSFRRDFPLLKEVRLHQNYRSTRCIVEAATALIQHNQKRCQEKQAHTDNAVGDKIVVMECRTEAAQCAFVVDNILMNSSGQGGQGSLSPQFGNVAVLYRRQVTGKMFQAAFRSRKVPFNVHGVAFYRKKVIKIVTSILWTILPGNTDIYWRRVLKALYSGDKSETKRVVDYVDKVAKGSKCSLHKAAQTIFTAKVSGTFNRKQLALGRRVLTSVDVVHRIAHKERSLSGLITAVVNLLPQRHAFDSRAVKDDDGGKLLNEDDDPRTVLEYFLDDVNDFLSNVCQSSSEVDGDVSNFSCGQQLQEDDGCLPVLKAFLDHLVSREADNFQKRREDNKNSVTLTTMHQSKGLEWDMVYIIKANDTETPLLNEARGQVADVACSLEEERRLFYVAMTRARKKLYMCYVVVDNQRQVLQPSRFLKEIPRHLLLFQGDPKQDSNIKAEGHTSMGPPLSVLSETSNMTMSPNTVTKNTSKQNISKCDVDAVVDLNDDHCPFEAEDLGLLEAKKEPREGSHEQESNAPADVDYGAVASTFLKGFNMESRSTISALFNSWARKPAFQDPKRLLSKVGFVVDERLRSKNTKNKDILIALKCCLKDDAAMAFAMNAIKWGQLPSEERALLQAERQEHFQQQSSERSMGAAAATTKQVAFLRSLGCTVDPTSRLHASKLIEQYKKL